MMNDRRRDEARRLRAETRMSLAQLRDHFGVSRDTMADWLWGLPTPEWTRRPNAKDDLRAQAVALRRAGCTVPQIAERVGVAKSSVYQWVKHLPLDATVERAHERRSEHSRRVAEARWEPHRQIRDTERAATNVAESARVGDLSEREVLLMGAAIYSCEGTKAKQWARQRCRVTFINSDPALVLLFLRFVELMGEDRAKLCYRLSIHESAEVGAAVRWWAEVVGVPDELFRPSTLKKHNPVTVRHNVGESYRGCLIVVVPHSRELYWKIEGLMGGIAVASGWPGGANM
jgi:DNA-binding XRE family transcriptional regulator